MMLRVFQVCSSHRITGPSFVNFALLNVTNRVPINQLFYIVQCNCKRRISKVKGRLGFKSFQWQDKLSKR
jgi:hypothetical protein